jgi:hypothetical protein
MAIEGKIREQKDFTKQVGIFEAEVICINPTAEEYKEILGIELKEDSKSAEYLGESKENNTYLRLNFWLKNMKTQEIFQSPISFFLEDKQRKNKEDTKLQYINAVGGTTWADDPNNLPEWFVGKDHDKEYRVAYVGEEELYDFLRTWLGKLDYRDKGAILRIEWKKLMKGNVKELQDQIGGEYACNVGVLATVVTRENKEGEIKEYQGIYNKAFLPPYAIKNFRLVDYSDKDVIAKISAKKPKDQKPYEKFVLKVVGEYGCKDFYILKDLQEYDPSMNIVSTEKVIGTDDPSY